MIKKDPRNARVHNTRNQRAIRESLELGAGRSILVDADNVIIGGNGVFAEAEKLGIPVRVVDSDGSELIAVRRTDLHTDDAKRKALAVADNRTGDLSHFDDAAVVDLLKEAGDFALKAGFSAAEITRIAETVDRQKGGDTPEVEFAQELLECHNYVVLVFDNEVDWLQAQTLLKLKSIRSHGKLKQNGIGRVVRGPAAIAMIQRGAK